ncbi:MAG: putative zinc finger in N-recognin-domain-containing protein [Benniella sp.]|nr:MAG: putative zinc finger in N-recognin-domain-containing protein [Benniella sp.]
MAEQDTITVSEYIAEQERLEKEAKELFPKKFDICSNSMGYIRQPVYSCLTCNPNPSEEAGFCYSCSISCHGEHNLVELFTKRHFRCDCGTEKFKATKCKLDPKPAGSINELNRYNHNYLGRFCWCDILYDPSKEESTMLQCVVCEDWFHDTCIGITPHNDDFDDFICRDCTRAHPFLRRYASHPLFMIALSEKDGGPKATTMVDCSKKDTKNGDGKHSSDTKGKSVVTEVEQEVDVVTVDDSATRTIVSSTSSTATTVSTTTIETSTTTVSVSLELSQDSEQLQTSNQGKRSLESTEDTAAEERGESGPSQIKKLKLETVPCKLKDQPSDAYPDQEMNLFATEGWRDLLCQCDDCTTLYTKENVSFILGEEPIFEDEEDDDAETSLLESGMKKLSEMDRVKMMDGMLAYNKMRDEIRTFLAPFSEQGKVVTAEDIQAFFTAKMEQRAEGKPNFF